MSAVEQRWREAPLLGGPNDGDVFALPASWRTLFITQEKGGTAIYVLPEDGEDDTWFFAGYKE